jgi:hypothetical protein
MLDRKFRWAANFFIWTAVILFVLVAPSVYRHWLRTPLNPSFEENAGALAGLVGSVLGDVSPFINALILRRYKSRISAALFIAFGLWGLITMLRDGAGTALDLVFILFWATYFLIAVWTLYTVIRRIPCAET